MSKLIIRRTGMKNSKKLFTTIAVWYDYKQGFVEGKLCLKLVFCCTGSSVTGGLSS